MVNKKLTEGIHVGILGSLLYGEETTIEDALKWKRYQIMKEMHWTYAEYQNTPACIIDEIYALLRTENKAMNTNLKEAK